MENRDTSPLAMYFPQAYKSHDHQQLSVELRKEGWAPLLVEDPPGRVYERHQHPEEKLLVFLDGTMKVWVEGEEFQCQPGDKLLIPGRTEHAAVAGPEGCTFYWSER